MVREGPGCDPGKHIPKPPKPVKKTTKGGKGKKSRKAPSRKKK